MCPAAPSDVAIRAGVLRTFFAAWQEQLGTEMLDAEAERPVLPIAGTCVPVAQAVVETEPVFSACRCRPTARRQLRSSEWHPMPLRAIQYVPARPRRAGRRP
jgi:hypothetical protein